MLNLKKWISKVTSLMTNYVIRERVMIASGLTIPANSILGATQTVSAAKDGYAPLGIVGTISNNNQIAFMRCEISLAGTIYARVANLSSSQITGVSIQCDVLYRRLGG